MKEVKGNLWDFPTDAVVITTNGYVRRNGTAVMGRGTALQAARRFPGIASILGAHIQFRGNVVASTNVCGPHDMEYKTIVFFPVKYNWWEKADLELIERSAHQLVALTDVAGWKAIAMPRPGCGNGQLDWSDVKAVVAPILDDRFTVIEIKED